MTVSSITVRDDFASYFKGALHGAVAPGLAVVRDFTVTQDDDAEDPNAQSMITRELRSATAFCNIAIAQKSSNNPGGRCYAAIEFAADTPEEFHAILKMVSDGMAAVATRANSQNWRDNSIPTLTAFSAPVVSGAAAAEVEITLAAMKTQGDEADGDGTVDGFVVQAVSAGTLKIGTSATTATAYAAGVNDVIDATHNAYWTVPAGGAGAVNAFTVKAMDNDRWLSATAIQVQVTRT